MRTRRSLSTALWITVASALLALPASSLAAPSVLDGDARLERRLTLEGPVISLPNLVDRLHRETGVELMLQGELIHRPIAVRQGERSARQLLEQLAILFDGRWVKKEDSYILVTSQVPAKAAAKLTGKPKDTEKAEWRFFRSLTKAQRQTLERNRRLEWSELKPRQQALARSILRERYRLAPHRLSSSVLEGQGVTVQVPPVPYSPWPISLRAQGIRPNGDAGLVTISQVWTYDGRKFIPTIFRDELAGG